MSVVAKNIKIIALLALFGAVMLGNLGGWELKGADEPRYAQIAREMRETGRYIVPHLNAEMYPDKPPLFFWLMALAAVPSGDVSAFEARLPSVLAGLGLILLTYLFAARLFDRGTGPACCRGAVLLRAVFQHHHQRPFRRDTVILDNAGPAAFLYRLHPCGKGEKIYARGLCRHGGALLTKGPVGLVIPLATMLLFVLARKEFGRIKDLHIGKGLIIAVGIISGLAHPRMHHGRRSLYAEYSFQTDLRPHG